MYLQQARELSKLTQTQLAVLIGSTQANISIWERAMAHPQKRTKQKIEKVLGPITWFTDSPVHEEFEIQQVSHVIAKLAMKRSNHIQDLYNLLNQWADWFEDTYHVR